MKDFTRQIKNEFHNDYDRVLHPLSNSRRSKMSIQQINQSMTDRRNALLNKWNKLLRESETHSQKDYCNRMIDLIDSYM